MGQHPPALRVQPGDTIVMHTLDALGVDRAGARRGEPPNPQSGPIWVADAAPGDALEVRIVRLTPSRELGWTRYPLAPNVVDPDRATRLPDRETANWAIDVAAETVRLVDPPPALANLVLPLEPMIGCFGVAPADGEAISTDRKSTRLNSSHGYISYAVFCLKKKKTAGHAVALCQPFVPAVSGDLPVEGSYLS